MYNRNTGSRPTYDGDDKDLDFGKSPIFYPKGDQPGFDVPIIAVLTNSTLLCRTKFAEHMSIDPPPVLAADLEPYLSYLGAKFRSLMNVSKFNIRAQFGSARMSEDGRTNTVRLIEVSFRVFSDSISYTINLRPTPEASNSVHARVTEYGRSRMKPWPSFESRLESGLVFDGVDLQANVPVDLYGGVRDSNGLIILYGEIPQAIENLSYRIASIVNYVGAGRFLAVKNNSDETSDKVDVTGVDEHVYYVKTVDGSHRYLFVPPKVHAEICALSRLDAIHGEVRRSCIVVLPFRHHMIKAEFNSRQALDTLPDFFQDNNLGVFTPLFPIGEQQ